VATVQQDQVGAAEGPVGLWSPDSSRVIIPKKLFSNLNSDSSLAESKPFSPRPWQSSARSWGIPVGILAPALLRQSRLRLRRSRPVSRFTRRRWQDCSSRICWATTTTFASKSFWNSCVDWEQRPFRHRNTRRSDLPGTQPKPEIDCRVVGIENRMGPEGRQCVQPPTISVQS